MQPTLNPSFHSLPYHPLQHFLSAFSPPACQSHQVIVTHTFPTFLCTYQWLARYQCSDPLQEFLQFLQHLSVTILLLFSSEPALGHQHFTELHRSSVALRQKKESLLRLPQELLPDQLECKVIIINSSSYHHFNSYRHSSSLEVSNHTKFLNRVPITLSSSLFCIGLAEGSLLPGGIQLKSVDTSPCPESL